MLQLQLINKTKLLAEEDKNISSLLMYGSFIKGEGDEFSDVEFYVFYHNDFDHEKWVNQICETLLFFTNEFGTEVAIFDNMIRGEFHFLPISEVNIIASWEGLVSFEYYKEMVLVDKDFLLTSVLDAVDKKRPAHSSQDYIDWVYTSLINSLLQVRGLIERGELAHAQQAFQFIQKYILYLIRIEVGADNHWESPTKKAEIEIPIEWYDVYENCIPSLNGISLREKYDYCLDILKKEFKNISASDNVKEVLYKIKLQGYEKDYKNS